MKKVLIKAIVLVIIGLTFFTSSCSNHADSVTKADHSIGQGGAQQMMGSIAKDISAEGPVAWLSYFENTPDFFMASEGALAFSNFEAAKSFINNDLVKAISKIELQWNNIRIDSLAKDLADVSAIYHEDISFATGKKVSENGYFTGVAHQTPQGWKLHNAHWSTLVDKQKQKQDE